MNISGYTAQILGGEHFNRNEHFTTYSSYKSHNRGDYVALNDGQEYKIRMRNDNSIRCNARVKVDGKNIGVWRIKPHSEIIIERPTNVYKKFVFYKSKTAPRNAGIIMGKYENGLVQIEFIPEIHYDICCTNYPEYMSYTSEFRVSPTNTYLQAGRFGSKSINQSCCTSLNCPVMSRSAFDEGATALKGRSNQYFGSADSIDEDYGQIVKISLRLVGRKHPTHYVYDVEPLNPYTSNPVPPPMFNRTDMCRSRPGVLNLHNIM